MKRINWPAVGGTLAVAAFYALLLICTMTPESLRHG